MVESIGASLRTIMAIPTGILMDKYSLKKLIIFAEIIGIFTSLMYFLAFDWKLIAVGLMLEVFAMRIDRIAAYEASYACLKSEDIATGSGLNSTLTSLSIIFASLAGAFLLSMFGGLTTEGIRPLFIFQIIGGFFAVIVHLPMSNLKLRKKERNHRFLKDIMEVFKKSPYLKFAILMNIFRMSSMSLLTSFKNVYLVEIRNADAIIIGSMSALSTAIIIIFALPLGNIVNRFGRKKLLYLLKPSLWISLLLIILARSNELLLLAAIFDGINRIWMEVILGTFMFELVPLDSHGRWIAITNFTNGIGGIIMPLIGGLLYDILPESIFYVGILMDIMALLVLKKLPDIKNS